MTQEQFQQFWPQLKAPLQSKWGSITDADILEINSRLSVFDEVLQKRYGDLQKQDVQTWADRRHAHWSGNYFGYKDPLPES